MTCNLRRVVCHPIQNDLGVFGDPILSVIRTNYLT